MTKKIEEQAEARLPLFYQSLTPLSSNVHGTLTLGERKGFPFVAGAHAVPLTVEEFVMAQRSYPIVFGTGEAGVPLALFGLSEGENQFVATDGTWRDASYIPAYVRRYPFLLAKLTPEADNLSLCYDDKSDLFSEGKAGNLFDGTEPTEMTKSILQFCEQFEVAIQRTRAFMNELNELDLLMDGEAQITNGDVQAVQMRGFRMVNEQKLMELRGDQHRRLVKSGALALIYAHLFSLGQIQDLYNRRALLEQQAA